LRKIQDAVSVRHNTYPIFAYGGTFNGTINGIFTDSLATVSAGTFVAPFAFTPLATLPRGIQTLYVKITSGACSYVVPFSYNTLTSSVLKLDAEVLGLQQNRPNPFSQETTIAFTLPETNKAVLAVYDITGRQVFTSNKDFKAGYNEMILNKSIFQNTGTYFYRLTTDKYAAVKKLQFVAE
jgi:Secretion system C-terminal sorting domain